LRGHDEPVTLTLGAQRGSRVALFFYPRDFTFVCPTEIQAFATLHKSFAREGAVVWGASTDSYYSHKAWFETDPRLRGVSFPVLADTSQRLSAAYQVLLDDGTALRGTFLIDPDGILRHVLMNDLDVGRNVEETLRTLRALHTGELCPVAWQPGESTLSNQIEKEKAA
jgi:alkyl hydroperoxide reductase subunit AhpC